MSQGTTTFLQQQLVLLQQGDEKARDLMIDRACRRLRRLAHRIIQDHPGVRKFEDTGDLLQTALIRMMRSLKARPPGSVEEFFRLAALEMRHALIDLARHYFGPQGQGAREVQAAPPAGGDSQAPVEADAGDGSHEPTRLAAWTEFHEAVEKLPAEERALFDLLWYHEMTQDEAAQALNCSLATVKRRWLTARLKLQELCPNLAAR